MLTGKLDRVIVIKSVVESQDGDGATTSVWSTHKTIWAERKDLRMRERMQANQVDPRISAKYFAHYDSTITEKMRIVDGSDTFEILGVAEIGRKEGIEITAGTV